MRVLLSNCERCLTLTTRRERSDGRSLAGALQDLHARQNFCGESVAVNGLISAPASVACFELTRCSVSLSNETGSEGPS